MSHAYYHAKSSAQKFGGDYSDYIKIHSLMDAPHHHFPDNRSRAIWHSSFAVEILEKIFGVTIKNSDGQDVCVSKIAEQHIMEDHGFIPTLKDWLSNLQEQDWMHKRALPLSKQK